MAKLSKVHESAVPAITREGAGRAESPEMTELRQMIKDLIGQTSERGAYELEEQDKDATIRQRLMQAAKKEGVQLRTSFHKGSRTFYFQVAGPREESPAGEDGSGTKRGRPKKNSGE